MTRRLLETVLLVVAVLWPCVAAGQDRKANDPEAAKKSISVRRAQILERMWWNTEEVVQSLNLDTYQREQMNELLAAFWEREDGKQLAKEHGELGNLYAEALEQGDMPMVLEITEGFIQLSVERQRQRVQLKIEIFSLLTAEQRSLLRPKYRRLFRHQFVGQPEAFRPPAGDTTPPAKLGQQE